MKKRIVSRLICLSMLIFVSLLLYSCGGGIKPVHNHKYKYQLVQKTEGIGFELSGKCTAIGCPDPYYSEKDINVVVLSEKAATCTEKGERTYGYEKEGQKLSLTVELPIASHSLNGSFIDDFANQAGKVSFGASGIKLYPESVIACESTVNGYYDCSVCSKRINVEVYIDHEGEWTSDTEKKATCISDGAEIMECMRCGKVNTRIVSALGHRYGLAIVDNGNGTTTLSGVCTVAGCPSPYLYEREVTEFSLLSESESTCSKIGVKEYSFKKNGELRYLTVYSDTLPHKIVGFDGGTSFNEDGSVNYGTAGVTLYNEGSIVNCTDSAYGYFTCEVCNYRKTVRVVNSHDGVWKYSVDRVPSCTEPGEKYLDCIKCGERITAEVPALMHTYSFELREGVISGIYTLDGTCLRSGCSAPRVSYGEVSDVFVVYERPATCGGSGEIVYSFMKDGANNSVTSYTKPLVHSVNGKSIDSYLNGGSVEYGTGGFFAIDTSLLKCGESTDGYYICDFCDTKQSVTIRVTSHYLSDESLWQTVEPTCMADGKLIKKCKFCSYVKEEKILRDPSKNYHALAWIKTPESSPQSAVFNGRCVYDGCSISYVNVAADAGSYRHVEERATCETAGYISDSWTVKGETVEYKTPLPMLEHTVRNNGGEVVDASTLKGEYGYYSYQLEAIKYYGDAPACGGVASGYFVCVGCENNVNVTVYKKHEWSVETENVATCTSDGIKIECCDLCGEKQYSLLAKGHIYGCVYNKVNDSVTVNCTRGDSACTFRQEVIRDASSKWHEKEVLVESTCVTKGVVLYEIEYLLYGNSQKSKLSVEVEVPEGDHKIIGYDGLPVIADSLKDENGYFDGEIPGIKPFRATDVLSCTTPVDGYFVCTECEGMMYVGVVKKHDVIYTVDEEPTCTAQGRESGVCKSCKGTVSRPIPAISHEYEYSVNGTAKPTLNADGTALLECKNCHHRVPVILPKAVIGVNAVIIRADASGAPSVIKYSCVTEYGVKVEFEITL